MQLFYTICHTSAVPDFESGVQLNREPVATGHDQFEREAITIKPTCTTDHDHIPTVVDSNSYQTDSVSVQERSSSLIGDKNQHVRFNVYEVPSSDSENGSTLEESNIFLPDVIELSSDEEQPPKPKRAKTHSTAFPMTKSSSFSHTGGLDLSLTVPSHGQSHSLDDSLEEFEMQQDPLEYTLAEVQSANPSCEGEFSMNQHMLALSRQATFNQPHTQNHRQSYDVFSGSNTTSFISESPSTASRQAYTKRDGLFDPSLTDASGMNSSSSAMNLLSYSSWTGKTPTQKQIRDSVMKSLATFNPKPGSYDPFPPPNNHVTNTARMAREYFSGAPPPSFMAGAVVRRTPPLLGDGCATLAPVVERIPVKSLSLGCEDQRSGKTIRLQCDDRAVITSGSQVRGAADKCTTANGLSVNSRQWQIATTGGDDSGLYSLRNSDNDNYDVIKGSYPSVDSFEREQAPSAGRFANLKAFHQQQNLMSHGCQPSDSNRSHTSLPVAGDFRTRRRVSGSSEKAESSVLDDPWLGCGLIGPSARAQAKVHVHIHVCMM